MLKTLKHTLGKVYVVQHVNASKVKFIYSIFRLIVFCTFWLSCIVCNLSQALSIYFIKQSVLVRIQVLTTPSEEGFCKTNLRFKVYGALKI